MITLNQFAKSKWSLLVFQKNKRIFASKKKGLRPILDYLKKIKKRRNLIIFDKIIGGGAALLFTLIKPKIIYTKIISQKGLNILKKYNISCQFLKKVKRIIDHSKECQMEKLSKNKSPKEFYKILKQDF